MVKPVIIVTVCRRYFEIERTLRRIRSLHDEFSEPVDVVVVWARPEVGRFWFFQDLLAEGLITKLLTRPPLPGEADGLPTTYPESHNLRMGLEWVKNNYPTGSTYAIGQAADIFVEKGLAYRYFDSIMTESDTRAVVLHWENGCGGEVWHTNFFATSLDEAYWPPVVGPESPDVLEAAWGRTLKGLPGIERNHNSRGRRFLHLHESESQPDWPIKPQFDHADSFLLITGYMSIYNRVGVWLGRTISAGKRLFGHGKNLRRV